MSLLLRRGWRREEKGEEDLNVMYILESRASVSNSRIGKPLSAILHTTQYSTVRDPMTIVFFFHSFFTD